MGAQDDNQQGWYELPFWRMVKYVAYGVLAGFFSGMTCVLIVISSVYPPILSILASSLLAFLSFHWWITPAFIGILSIIPISYFITHKKKPLEVKQKQ